MGSNMLARRLPPPSIGPEGPLIEECRLPGDEAIPLPAPPAVCMSSEPDVLLSRRCSSLLADLLLPKSACLFVVAESIFISLTNKKKKGYFKTRVKNSWLDLVCFLRGISKARVEKEISE
jgi:hypothetical protein